MARILLETFPATVPAWSYRAVYANDTPILGTYHSTDLPHIYYNTDNMSRSIQHLYISFVDCLDPNNYTPSSPNEYLSFWPTWQEKKQLLELGDHFTRLIEDDDSRAASFQYIRTNLEILHL